MLLMAAKTWREVDVKFTIMGDRLLSFKGLSAAESTPFEGLLANVTHLQLDDLRGR